MLTKRQANIRAGLLTLVAAAYAAYIVWEQGILWTACGCLLALGCSCSLLSSTRLTFACCRRPTWKRPTSVKQRSVRKDEERHASIDQAIKNLEVHVHTQEFGILKFTGSETSVQENSVSGYREISWGLTGRFNAELTLSVVQTQPNRLKHGTVSFSTGSRHFIADFSSGLLREGEKTTPFNASMTSRGLPVYLFKLTAWDQIETLQGHLTALAVHRGDETWCFTLHVSGTQQLMKTASAQGRLLTKRSMWLSCTAQALACTDTMSKEAAAAASAHFVYVLYCPSKKTCCLIGTQLAIPTEDLDVCLTHMSQGSLDLGSHAPMMMRFGRAFAFQGLVNPDVVGYDVLGPPESTFIRLLRSVSLFAPGVGVRAVLCHGS